MVSTPTPPSPSSQSGTASPAPNAEGYLLLTIQHAVVKQVFEGETMTLAKGEMRIVLTHSVECVSLPIPATIGKQTANPFAPSPSDPLVPTHDFWLVLHVGSTFEMPLVPESYLTPANSKEGLLYTIPSPSIPNAALQLILPRPDTAADMEDLDSFEVLLRQYRSLGSEATALTGVSVSPLGAKSNQTSPNPAPEDMRGKVVLVNEETGEVVGELDQAIDVQENKNVSDGDKNRPVVLDFGNVVEGYAPKVVVQTIREEDMDDWMLRGAHQISRGILSFSSWSQRMMNSGADLYIRNSTPCAEPVKFSPTAKAGIRRAHNASVKTVNVTKTTVGMINNAIMRVVDKAYDTGVKPALNAYDRINADEKFSDNKSPSSKGSAAPIPSKAGMLKPGQPGFPPRASSPLSGGRSAVGIKIDIPNESDTLLATEKAPPAYTETASERLGKVSEQSAPTSPNGSSADSKTKRPLLNRLFLAGEVVLTSLEATAHDLINTGTAAASSAAGHKYGPEAGQATALLGGSVRNVAVVYIDVRGVGRRALLKSSAKGFVKARLRNGEEIRLQGEGRENAGVQVDAGEIEPGRNGEAVIGMKEVQRRKDSVAPSPVVGEKTL